MTLEVLPVNEWHPSQRGYFAGTLHAKMETNKDIVVITADLGFGMFDKIKNDYPDRFFNVGASESSAVGIACGMVYRGKLPIVYSITPFLLYRPYEWLRNYVNKEQLPVKLVGSGRDSDYEIDGFTHDASDAKRVLDTLPNIVQMWPEEKEDVFGYMNKFLTNGKPTFMSLRR
jgi:transketolase